MRVRYILPEVQVRLYQSLIVTMLGVQVVNCPYEGTIHITWGSGPIVSKFNCHDAWGSGSELLLWGFDTYYLWFRSDCIRVI